MQTWSSAVFTVACVLCAVGLSLCLYVGSSALLYRHRPYGPVLASIGMFVAFMWWLGVPFFKEGLAVIAGTKPVPNYEIELIALPVAMLLVAVALFALVYFARKPLVDVEH